MLGWENLLIETAWAADAVTTGAATVAADAAGQAAGGRDTFMSFVPFILIALIIYFFMIRPQQKNMATRAQMLKEIKKGDKIITGGGLAGTVVKVDGDDWLMVEIADGVTVRALRSTINGPAETAKADAAKTPANQK